ncbi:peptide chain release factor N(5)-glutamine methyltransferase [Thiomicrorhabdus aquaedulcis]|uniref:peptide chain release factor N(5)-glutamine methyltransferase n=1 Tax=Thiomicrorhabdus aquaedulcis TaxID=2211106 RepID=UPI000FDBD8F3|nr:peptide chain release factor N(5)-glutamine methyltransferase [Thiomicrorhabdus aquaedulcis]
MNAHPANTVTTLQSLLDHACSTLILAGQTDSPKLDAHLLLAHVLQVSRTHLITWSDQPLLPQQIEYFNQLFSQRVLGHPIAHLTGEREFWGLTLKVTADTLIPRPDSETLIEAVLERMPPKHINTADLTFLDLGCGTGALALALQTLYPNARVFAVDMSHAALAVAQHNAATHQLPVQFLHSNWLSAFSSAALPELALRQFDCIVSNPPYIEADDAHLTQGDVRFEPLRALVAGQDGLDDIKIIINQAWSHLKPQGHLLIEHGYNQADAVAALLHARGYAAVTLYHDLGQQPRITAALKPS